MKMDEHARAWTHEFVSGILAGAGLPPEQRSSLHWEIVSHLHEKAEHRVEGRGGNVITLADLQAVVNEMGGRDGVSAAFLQTRVVASPRAGFAKRFGAFIVDALLIGLVTGVVIATMSAMFWWLPFYGPDFPFGFFWFALAYGYFVLAESKYGQTIGKRLLNLRTVMEDGRPLTMEATLIRNISKVVPPLLLLDVIFYFVSYKDKDQRASDVFAHTIVIDTTKGTWTQPAPAPVPAPQPPSAPAPPSPDPKPPEFRPVPPEERNP